MNNPLKYTDPTGNFGEGWLLHWAYSIFGNYAINVADNVINKDMPLGKALGASTVSASVNYSPSMNTFSNYQVDAYTSAAHLEDVAQDLDQQVASFSGMGSYSMPELSIPVEGVIGMSPLAGGIALFEPQRLDVNVYSNLLEGMKYPAHQDIPKLAGGWCGYVIHTF